MRTPDSTTYDRMHGWYGEVNIESKKRSIKQQSKKNNDDASLFWDQRPQHRTSFSTLKKIQPAITLWNTVGGNDRDTSRPQHMLICPQKPFVASLPHWQVMSHHDERTLRYCTILKDTNEDKNSINYKNELNKKSNEGNSRFEK